MIILHYSKKYNIIVVGQPYMLAVSIMMKIIKIITLLEVLLRGASG